MVDSVSSMETEIQDKLESDTPIEFASSEPVSEQGVDQSVDSSSADSEEVTLNEQKPQTDLSRFVNNAQESKPAPAPEESDDTDLYSLRNFSL